MQTNPQRAVIHDRPDAGPPSLDATADVSHVAPEGSLVDVMGGSARHEIRIHEHGFIALVDAMPRLVPEGQTGDSAIVQAARVSYGQGTRRLSEDSGLIRYLLRHRHTTPFEMVEFKFHVAMPIFVARQWIRHRTANVNEYSGRYSIIKDEFYRPSPDGVRKQSASNRQGGSETFAADGPGAHGNPAAGEDQAGSEQETARAFLDYLDRAEALYEQYEDLTRRGVSRELARIGLPVSVYTQWYWKCDLHNILRFLSLRMDSHAQEEIRVYAHAMHRLIEPIVPVTLQAWRDYEFKALRLTRLEIEAIRSKIGGRGDGSLNTTNRREQQEWEQKRASLGL